MAVARQDRSVEIATATHVLQVLGELEGAFEIEPGKSRELRGRALDDERLRSAKRVLFFYPYVRVRCGGGHHLDWVTITPVPDTAFRLIHLPEIPHARARDAGVSIVDTKSYILDKYHTELALGTPSSLGDEWRAVPGVGRRFDYDVEFDDDFGPRVVAVTTSEPAQPRRDGHYGDVDGLFADYACSKCTRRHSVRHVSLLRSWLHAIIVNERTIVLGESPGTQSPARPRAVRVENHGSALAWSSSAARGRRRSK